MSEIAVEVVDPRGGDARAAITAYQTEFGQDPAPALADVDHYLPPHGTFLVVRVDGTVRACGALRTLAPGVGEIKRMWVDPEARGRGLGALVLERLESAATDMGHGVVRLDTIGELRPAVGLYESRSYRRIDRYNDNYVATHFYEKRLHRPDA